MRAVPFEADRLRLEEHFDQVRDLERRVATIPEPSGAYESPPDPGPDPSVETDTVERETMTVETGWASETDRAFVLADLVHMAFACDQTRVASLMFTYAQCFMTARYILGRSNSDDVHQMSHGAGDISDMTDIYAWHVGPLAYLVDKLRNTPEGEGTLLDNTAIVFVTEGGWGYDPGSGKDGAPHSTENIGRPGGGSRRRPASRSTRSSARRAPGVGHGVGHARGRRVRGARRGRGRDPRAVLSRRDGRSVPQGAEEAGLEGANRAFMARYPRR